ncbi:MAG: hypothetical protein RL352_588, partial [Actinomycetota bacterium]
GTNLNRTDLSSADFIIADLLGHDPETLGLSDSQRSYLSDTEWNFFTLIGSEPGR